MKKLLSILLALTMMLSLFGVAALADEEAEEVQTEEIEIEESAETLETEETAPVLTILLTGEVGLPAAEETEVAEDAAAIMGYAGAAALKEYYARNGAALLADAGGFVLSAADVMEAAGYDLAVTGETIESETLVALAPVAGSASGMMVNKNDMILAFIGIDVPAAEAEQTEEGEEIDPNAALYAVIQESVDKAAEADYVILIGLCADAQALAENITGADAILTTGEGVQTIEKEDETSVLVVGVEAAFGSVGVVTVDGDGIAAELLDAEDYAALALTESEELLALEAAWIEEANKPAEEQPEETQQPEEPEQTDSVAPTPAVTPETVPGDDGAGDAEEETPGADAEGEAPVVDGEEAPAGDGEEEIPAGDGEEEIPAGDGEEEIPAGDDEEETPAGDDEEETPAGDDEEEAPAGDGEEETPAGDGEDETPADDGEEVTPTPEPTAEPDTTINWSKGTDDLEITFEARVSELKIGSNKLVEGSDYTVGEGGNVVSISANMLNGWGNGKYEFVAVYPDGSQSSQMVSISGEYEAPAPTDEPTPTPTQEPDPTAEPDTTINWSKGTDDLRITFENRVSQLKVGGNTLVEGSDYTVSGEGNTVSISANMMNGWPNAKYAFTAIYPDGSQASRMVSVTGEYKAPEAETGNENENLNNGNEIEEEATATPAPTKTPSGTPNTGDSNPIVLYVVILVVLAAALVVVLVMTGQKNKRR